VIEATGRHVLYGLHAAQLTRTLASLRGGQGWRMEDARWQMQRVLSLRRKHQYEPHRMRGKCVWLLGEVGVDG